MPVSFARARVVSWLLLVGAVAAPLPVLADCSLEMVQGVAFGSYDPLDPAHGESSGTITVQCSILLGIGSESFDILLSTGSSGSYSPRQMLNPASDALDYNLYLDSARSQVWGDGTGGTGVKSDTLGALISIGTVSEDYPVYGRLFANQDVPADSYVDTITVTLDVQ